MDKASRKHLHDTLARNLLQTHVRLVLVALAEVEATEPEVMHALAMAYVTEAARFGAKPANMLAGLVVVMTDDERRELALLDGRLHERIAATLPPEILDRTRARAPRAPRLRRPARHRAAGAAKLIKVPVRVRPAGGGK